MAKVYDSMGTDIELAEAMLDNIKELTEQLNGSDMEEAKKAGAISKLEFTRRFISGFAKQL